MIALAQFQYVKLNQYNTPSYFTTTAIKFKLIVLTVAVV